MKNIILYTIAILGVLSINYASAACLPRLTKLQIVDALEGNTVCVTATPHNSQEEHHPIAGDPLTGATGQLWDNKTGNTSDPIDPRKQMGTWAVGGRRIPVVIYTYFDSNSNPGPEYSFTLTDNGSDNYSFCQAGAEVVNADIYNGVYDGVGVNPNLCGFNTP